MNYPIAIAFGLICLTVLAHLFGGIRESLLVRPPASTSENSNSVFHEKVERHWIQLMCAFQLVSIDLIAVAIVLYLLAFTAFLQPASLIAIGMAVFFLCWGVVWLVQIACLKRTSKDYVLLPQWVLWFLCSGLMLMGAQTLKL